VKLKLAIFKKSGVSKIQVSRFSKNQVLAKLKLAFFKIES
jgi:hypothetical protein